VSARTDLQQTPPLHFYILLNGNAVPLDGVLCLGREDEMIFIPHWYRYQIIHKSYTKNPESINPDTPWTPLCLTLEHVFCIIISITRTYKMIRSDPIPSFFHPPSFISDLLIANCYSQFLLIGYRPQISSPFFSFVYFVYFVFKFFISSFPIYQFPYTIRTSQKLIIFYSKLFQIRNVATAPWATGGRGRIRRAVP